MNKSIDNLIIKEIKYIIIRKNRNDMECSLKINPSDSLNISFLTSKTMATGYGGDIHQIDSITLDDLFGEDVEIVINGIYEDSESGCIFNGECVIPVNKHKGDD